MGTVRDMAKRKRIAEIFVRSESLWGIELENGSAVSKVGIVPKT